MMKDILSIFNKNGQHDENIAKWSLSAQLEAFTGGYSVEGEGLDEWIKVYYKAGCDSYEQIISRDSLIAYVSMATKMALVLDEHIEKFKQDTKGYGFAYFPFDSFYEEQYYCSDPTLLPIVFSGIKWIDDDFLNDETIEFDFEAFEIIDTGVNYLNPKHFSIYDLMNNQIEYNIINNGKRSG